MDIKDLLKITADKNASDLLLTVGVKPALRIDGKLFSIEDFPILTSNDTEELTNSLMTPEQKQMLTRKKEMDFSFPFEAMRFRINVFIQRGSFGAALRLVPMVIPSPAELGLPPIVDRFINATQGLVVVTGPSGHGKSTSIASFIQEINKTRSEHIITIEDPIEYAYTNEKSIIEQREVFSDTHSFASGLRSVLRQDPNVVMVGEMRDLETIEAALITAETGHLVFTTLHTNDASQATERIINIFPPHQQFQVRLQLANVMLGIMAQRLLPRHGGGRSLATEILLASPAVRNLIREGKTYQLPNAIQTGAEEGMISLNKSLAELVQKGEVTLDEAEKWSPDPRDMKRMIYL